MCRLFRYKVFLYLGVLETHFLTLVFVSNKLMLSLYKSNVVFVRKSKNTSLNFFFTKSVTFSPITLYLWTFSSLFIQYVCLK